MTVRVLKGQTKVGRHMLVGQVLPDDFAENPSALRVEVVVKPGRRGTPDAWELVTYGGQERPRRITVERDVAEALGRLLVDVARDPDAERQLSELSTRAAHARRSVARSARSRNAPRGRPEITV